MRQAAVWILGREAPTSRDGKRINTRDAKNRLSIDCQLAVPCELLSGQDRARSEPRAPRALFGRAKLQLIKRQTDKQKTAPGLRRARYDSSEPRLTVITFFAVFGQV